MYKDIENTYWVIPCFNEGESLVTVLNDLCSVGVPANRLIVIDDGSSSGVVLQPTALPPGVVVLRHVINLGQGAALQTGVDFALSQGANYLITFDSDGQHSKDDAIMMLKSLCDRKELQCLVGSRFLGETIGMPGSRGVTLKLGILFTYFMTGYRFTDVHNGLRVFRSSFFDGFRFYENRMEHASEIMEHLARNANEFEEYPVTITYTEYSQEKGQSSMNSIKIAIKTIAAKLI
jgi:glycosyltransferase involved in cell wall biosynthesis